MEASFKQHFTTLTVSGTPLISKLASLYSCVLCTNSCLPARLLISLLVIQLCHCSVQLTCDDTRWRTGGEVKGKREWCG